MLQALPPAAQWLLLGIVAALTLLALRLFWRSLDQLVWVRVAARARARSASQGLVELSGHARAIPGPPIVAPLSRRDCVWYAFQSSGIAADDGYRHVRESGRSDAIFHLEDASGRCIVDPDGATVLAPRSETWFGDTRRPTIRSFGWKLEWLGMLRGMRYHEQRIEAGDRLYVLGEFESLRDQHHNDLAHETAAILAAWKHDPRRMQQIDSNGDGRIDEQEWETARGEALKRAALKLHAEDRTARLNVLRKPRNPRQPFIIAGFDEATLLHRLGWRAGLFAVLFVAGAALLHRLAPAISA